MLAALLIAAVLAAVLHVYIFVLESLRWSSPATRRTFGTTVEEAAATAQLAFNQGFYNLFLALMAGAGALILALGHERVGLTLLLAGTGAMLAAGLVLLLSAPGKSRAALTQLAFPLIAVVLGVLRAMG